MQLRRFAGIVEETLVDRVAALDEELKAAASLPAHEHADLLDWYAGDFLELGDELPTVLRYAILTAADTASEAFLNTTCAAYVEVSGAKVGVQDLRGSGILRAHQYLKKVAGVSFPDEKPVWATILRLHELRNCIVHSEGMVAPSRSTLRAWSVTMPGLRISDDGRVYLDAKFTSAALDAYEELATEIDISTSGLGLWKLELPFDTV